MTGDVERCGWCGTDPVYVAYHDREWGVPEWDGRALWEKLVLDGFQAGLSWITILKRRDAFRARFDGFDPEKVAAWGERQIAEALADPGIIRHRGKVEATVRGARLFLELEETTGFATHLWGFVDGAPVQHHYASLDQVPAQDEDSRAMSADLKKRGFTFVGPVICYAFMQAVGMVNDHLTVCFRHREVAALAG